MIIFWIALGGIGLVFLSLFAAYLYVGWLLRKSS